MDEATANLAQCIICDWHIRNENLRNLIKELEGENKKQRYAIGLLNSMVLSGEEHSDESKKIVKQALKGKKI